jgi:hypothetical protein
MFLARREIGKALRLYPLKTNDEPTAWKFDCIHPENGHKIPTDAALRAGSYEGVAATGHTRSEALANLQIAEEAAKHA